MVSAEGFAKRFGALRLALVDLAYFVRSDLQPGGAPLAPRLNG
jgi:hypothetical protein